MITFLRKIGARASSRSKKPTARILQFNLKIENHDIARNIEAWRKNIATEKTNQSADKQVTDEEKKDLSKFDSWTNRDKANTNAARKHRAF